MAMAYTTQWAIKLKKSRPKKHVKLNKSISRKNIFCSFKNGQKPIFELGKSLKLSKMQFHKKIN